MQSNLKLEVILFRGKNNGITPIFNQPPMVLPSRFCMEGPPSLARFVPGEVLVKTVAHELRTGDEALRQLKFHLERAQNQMTKFANCHRKPCKIKVGDLVYLKIRPHRQVSMPTRVHTKLSAKYYGPYLVHKQMEILQFNNNYLKHLVQLVRGDRCHTPFGS